MRKPPSLLHFLCLIVLSSSFSPMLAGQDTKVRASADPDRVNREQSDPDGDNPTAREEWFRSGRRAAGEHAADLLHRAYRRKLQMSGIQPAATEQPGTTFSVASPGQQTANGIPFTGTTYPGSWSSLGPAPIASDPNQDYGKVVGRVTSVAVDQGDTSGNTVYIGAAFGGVWKSTNAAAADPTTVQWKPLIDNQPTLAVGAISIQPGTTGNTAVVLVGTGESNSSGDSYYGMGILRSTDGGTTWNLIKTANAGAKTFAGLGASSFAWNGATVVVGMGSTNGKRYGSDSVGGRGIYYSQDAGLTWTYATVQDPTGTPSEGTVTSVVFNPGTQKFYAAYRYHGFYESSDGINWIRSANQPGTVLGAAGVTTTGACPTNQSAGIAHTCPLYRAQFAVQPVTHNLYVIFVDENDIDQGIFVSANPATTAWTEITSKGTAGLVDNSSTNEIVQGDYNLWLGALPTSQGTDLMVGTRNIYKCSLNSGNCTNTWTNLTFVYACNPIAGPSHVHPDQHGFDFNASTPLQMYFTNDGGVYRVLNGTSAATGTCASPNPFDNLDTNMGSLSEMVSFSEDPTNPNILLGGLQDNGSPALGVPLANSGTTAAAPLWQIINSGDGGYNEIDPNNPAVWYTEYSIINNALTIQQCTMGTSCDAAHFGLPPYPAQGASIASAQVGSDRAEFYTPYIIDTANASTSTLLVGTCRLWRGPGAGGNTWLDSTNRPNRDISPAFDSTAAVPCADGSTKIRAIAAGGPNSNGISQVVYVGMEGAGTSTDSGGNLGHVFVNTHADVNTGTHGASNGWTDVTGNIAASLTNSGGTYGPYPISSIEIDPHDVTGQTAYVTVEGFGVSHVFKTTNAGQSWTDLTNNLPDAPVDSMAVDPDDPSLLYLGTDVGAFISINAGAAWQILGTNLPNVPVTKIRVFENAAAGFKYVRVSTYGRGVWQFAMALPTPLMVSPTSLASFTGSVANPSQPQTVTVSNGGTGPTSIAGINFSNAFSQSGGTCTAGTSVPAGGSCSISVVFTATAAGQTSGTLSVTDSADASHSVSLSGNASDFTIAVGTGGASQTVTAGQPASYQLNLTSVDGFSGTVALACASGLPAGASCTFSPASVTVSGAAASTATLNISTTAHSTSQPAPTSGSLGVPPSLNVSVTPLLMLMSVMAFLALSRMKPLKVPARVFPMGALAAATLLASGCGGGGVSTTTTSSSFTSTGSAAGTYTVMVSATSGNRVQQTQLTLKVN